MKTLYLVRHGQSESNVCKGVLAYKANSLVELTDVGKQQASAAGTRLLDMRVESAQFFVSPYSRTIQTFEMIKQHVKCVKYTEDYRLREIDIGNFVHDWKKIAKERVLYKDRFFYRFPNGESCADVALRVDSFLKDQSKNFSEEYPNVIVTHAATMRIFQLLIDKLLVSQYDMLPKPKNCDIIKLEYHE